MDFLLRHINGHIKHIKVRESAIQRALRHGYRIDGKTEQYANNINSSGFMSSNELSLLKERDEKEAPGMKTSWDEVVKLESIAKTILPSCGFTLSVNRMRSSTPRQADSTDEMQLTRALIKHC